MPPSNTLTFRKNLLSNPAAEFVEQTAGVEALVQLQVSKTEAEQLDATVEFVPELDRSRLYYRLILHIVGQISEGPQGKPQSKARCCKSFVRKCYQKVDSNRGIVEGFLKMIPSDAYGALISGGFAIVLAPLQTDDANVNDFVPPVNTKIADALREFQDQAGRFQHEVDMCSDESLAVMRRDVAYLRNDTDQKIDKVLEFIQRLAATQAPLTPLELYNSLYNMFRVHEPKLIPPAVPLRDARKQNKKVAKHWDRDFEEFGRKALCDIKECLDQLEQLSFDDKGTSQRILVSAQITSWLTKEKSSMLLIDQETPHWDLANPISFTSALLAITLRSTNRFPVLTFFCMHRNNQSTKENLSGPIALVQSLNGQLFDFICKHRSKVNLAEVEDHDDFSASHRSHKKGLTLFSRLLSLLPEEDTVYIIIDTFSYLTGSDKKINGALERLRDMMKMHKHLLIMVLITDPLVGSSVYKMARMSLHLRDLVSGQDAVDFNAEKRKIKEMCNKDSSGTE
ncbi:hypothetical protein QBC40DRAFT_301637 [Triangularia verruculosa]|uniref:Uncharacterized protein n=1 Tax=Triangularia verruculosa TaxID=2587418 RepID=A0AAN6X774_9PEZI|nr:hypothetical protein QBC40DRAFT_301637 [Triangularia verruculosa]